MSQHQPRKRFGQHFLEDAAVLQQMAACISPNQSDHMIEIGPGLGALTQYLLHQVKRFDAIEVDRDLVKLLQERFAGTDDLHLHQHDVLHFPWQSLDFGQPFRVVGNLPYNISTPLIFSLFEILHLIQDMFFLLQLEVAERMAAQPSTKQYGRLSVMTQYFCDVELLFSVPPTAFHPPPKVHSAFIRLAPRPLSQLTADDPILLQRVVTEAFNHRRKTLSNSLKSLISADELRSLGIDPGLRAENLTVAEYISVCNYLAVE